MRFEGTAILDEWVVELKLWELGCDLNDFWWDEVRLDELQDVELIETTKLLYNLSYS